jgi:CubicO group peptidase (beta-lactamase class C family)
VTARSAQSPLPATATSLQDHAPRQPPTLSDWLTSPANKWTFRHARELFGSARVGAGAGLPLVAAPAVLGADVDLVSYLERSHTDALVVLHDGGVAHEWYASNVLPGDRHILFSVTKSVVGLVAGALIAEGVIDEEGLVASYVPEAVGGGYASVTVRQLLDMTANIRFVEDYNGPDLRRYREAVGQIPTPDSQGILSFAVGLPQDGPHGRAFKYVSPTADVVGQVCERATGRALADLITTYVWHPMGAESEGDLLLDRFGAPRASGGFCATARDMARIGQLLLGDAHSESVALAVEDVKRAGDRAAWQAGNTRFFLADAAYRNLWYQLGGDVFLAAGIHGQRIYVDVHRRVVIAQQASLPVAFDARTWSETIPLFRAIARTLAGA